MTQKKITNIVNKHYLEKFGGENNTVSTLFSFPYLQGIVRTMVNRKSLVFSNFLFEAKNTSKYQRGYTMILQQYGLDNKEIKELDKALEDRLNRTFHGLVAEEIVRLRFNISTEYKVIPVLPEDDYKAHIDIIVEHLPTGRILFIQVKTDYYLNYGKKVIDLEKESHEKAGLNVDYIFVRLDYENRSLIINGRNYPFKGFGRGSQTKFNETIYKELIEPKEKELKKLTF